MGCRSWLLKDTALMMPCGPTNPVHEVQRGCGGGGGGEGTSPHDHCSAAWRAGRRRHMRPLLRHAGH